MQRTIEDIVGDLKNAKGSGHGSTLLIGSGCSVTAGIPTASGFVDYIKSTYPQAFARAKEKTYPSCMAELFNGPRRDMIADFINKAKINWAHIAIAQMIKHGYVDRVLTTNFDPLVVRACALVGEFPAIYDFGASQHFNPSYIPPKSIFYLHGQHTGFRLMNTETECAAHADLLAPVFEDAGRGRVWLVVGYSGESDPVFQHLTKVPCFNYGLYWIGYKDTEPAKHIREGLLSAGKDAFHVNGYDADDFFVTLAQKLGCFPPDFVQKPFSHLDHLLGMVTSYSIPIPETSRPNQEAGDVDIHVPEMTRKVVQKAIRVYEKTSSEVLRDNPSISGNIVTSADILEAQSHLMAGNYDKVIAMLPKDGKPVSPELADPIAQALTKQGIIIYNKAEMTSGEEADQLFQSSYENYRRALEISPDFYEAPYRWGYTLYLHGRTKIGDESDRLFAESCEKYRVAIEIRPSMHEALNFWGSSLLRRGKLRTGKEADLYFSEAESVLLKAESYSPGSGAYNLACVHALRNNHNECYRWLEERYRAGRSVTQQQMITDTDFDSVRESEWFKEFIAKLK